MRGEVLLPPGVGVGGGDVEFGGGGGWRLVYLWGVGGSGGGWGGWVVGGGGGGGRGDGGCGWFGWEPAVGCWDCVCVGRRGWGGVLVRRGFLFVVGGSRGAADGWGFFGVGVVVIIWVCFW